MQAQHGPVSCVIPEVQAQLQAAVRQQRDVTLGELSLQQKQRFALAREPCYVPLQIPLAIAEQVFPRNRERKISREQVPDKISFKVTA